MDVSLEEAWDLDGEPIRIERVVDAFDMLPAEDIF
jgi:hypothetical protein